MLTKESATCGHLLLLKIDFRQRTRQVQVLIGVHCLVSRAYSHLRRAALIELLESGFGSLTTIVTATHYTTFDLEERHDKAELIRARVFALS